MSLDNFNVGIMGHVDAGKTSMARWLSHTASTCAFDKHPQSQARGITIDLGFSACQLARLDDPQKGLQLTFVDCPGHATLFRTVIGAAHIIDAVLLVLDATKGIQAQTAECLVLAELIGRPLMIAINKVDLLGAEFDEAKLRRQLRTTKFANATLVRCSTRSNIGKEECLAALTALVGPVPDRNPHLPLILAIDHGFPPTRGQAGLVVTGTILQGQVTLSDRLCLPDLRQQSCRVRSIQRFRLSTSQARAGDRVGLGLEVGGGGAVVPKIERTVATKTDNPIPLSKCFLLEKVEKISHFRGGCRSKSKFHISLLHTTVLARTVFFCRRQADSGEYELVEELDQSAWALVILDEAIPVPSGFLCIGGKLDLGADSKTCRLAFHGKILDPLVDLSVFRLFKVKERRALVDRVQDDGRRLIGRDLVDRKAGSLEKFISKLVMVDDKYPGRIIGPFGTTGKFQVQLLGEHCPFPEPPRSISVRLRKFFLQPGKPIIQ